MERSGCLQGAVMVEQEGEKAVGPKMIQGGLRGMCRLLAATRVDLLPGITLSPFILELPRPQTSCSLPEKQTSLCFCAL